MFTRFWKETRPTTNTMFSDEYYQQVLGKDPFINEKQHIDNGDLIVETSTSEDGLVRTYAIKFKSLAALSDYRVRSGTSSPEQEAVMKYMHDNGHLAETFFNTETEKNWWNSKEKVELPEGFWN